MDFSLRIGNGGWVELVSDGEAFAVVRFTEDDAGRLRPTELYLAGPVVSGVLLRSLQLGEIEGWVNSTGVAEHVRAGLRIPSVDLRRAASYYGTTFGETAFDENGRGVHWAVEMIASQYPDEKRRQRRRRFARPVVKGVPVAPFGDAHAEQVRRPRVNPRLKVPESGPYPDRFYEQVATVYGGLVATGQHPAPVIAEANGVPATTVHRWIRKARSLGFLGPGERGRAGG